MTQRCLAQLEWIDHQQDRMCRLVENWSAINTGTGHVAGIELLVSLLQPHLVGLGASVREVTLPPARSIDARGGAVEHAVGPALHASQRPGVSPRVLLGIHLDTVFGPEHPFQSSQRIDDHTLRGPGVCDAKGGLAVMLVALEALERSPWAGSLGWEVVLNPDEEIGSPSSSDLLRQVAAGCDIGLVFEPALPDGALIDRRKGSGNFTVVLRGTAAHVGRDFADGRSAVHALGHLVAALDDLNGSKPGLIVNVGRVEGGGPVNVVADLAIARLNIRIDQPDDQAWAVQQLNDLTQRIEREQEVAVQVHGGFHAPPKPLDDATGQLLEAVVHCGHDLGLTLEHRSSGGVCDGNRLAAAGLPTLDTLGPRGGGIHSDQEYLILDSLTQRAKLTALLLMKIAAGQLQPPRRTLVTPA